MSEEKNINREVCELLDSPHTAKDVITTLKYIFSVEQELTERISREVENFHSVIKAMHKARSVQPAKVESRITAGEYTLSVEDAGIAIFRKGYNFKLILQHYEVSVLLHDYIKNHLKFDMNSHKIPQ